MLKSNVEGDEKSGEVGEAAALRLGYARVLVNDLRSGDVVIMDNLSSHKGPRVREMIEAACQIASKRDPSFAPNADPCRFRCNPDGVSEVKPDGIPE